MQVETADELVITALRAPDGRYYVESIDSAGGNIDRYTGEPGTGLPALESVIEALAGAGYAVADRRSGYRNRTLITLRKQDAAGDLRGRSDVGARAVGAPSAME